MQAKRANAEFGISPENDTVTADKPVPAAPAALTAPLQVALFGEVRSAPKAPQRVQTDRQRPWRADHSDAIVVARPTAWGNPYRNGAADPVTGETIVDLAGAVAAFVKANGDRPAWITAARRELAGRDLACCRVDAVQQRASVPG